MAKLFSLLSWNIKHFSVGHTDKAQVVEHIKFYDPDIFALYEVKGKDVWKHLYDEFPDHNFFITEGPQTQEILIGTHKKLRVFYTQKDEFKAGRTFLRPGAFLTITVKDKVYTILFLHLKSLPNPEGFGLRDDMLNHVYNLKGALDRAAGGPGKANFIVAGDLNTMGLNYFYDNDVSAETEIQKLEYRAKKRDMKLLEKTHDSTWTNGDDLISNLDHIIASEHLEFTNWDGKQVKVDGWNRYKKAEYEYEAFLSKVSDHCSLYCEIVK